MTALRSCIALCLAGCLLCAPAQAVAPTLRERGAVHWLAQEMEVDRALDALSTRALRGSVIFRDVSIVDPVHGGTVPHQSVLVDGGKIAWVGDASGAPDAKGAFAVDGTGLFLSPGLVDMHVHTQSLSEQLLRLATGTTAVRDMDGFPWLLRLRRAIGADRILAPTEYIAGTIIADYPLSGYAVVVKSAADARQTVRDQAACGYDFVKVHNHLALDLFDAVADQARRSGKDLVGHIPHDIAIGHAVHSGGMRTLEHLKGFINDRNFLVSDEDFAAALKGAQVWLTPTFYAFRGVERHDGAVARELARPEMRYVRIADRNAWNQEGQIQPDWHDRLAAALPATLANAIRLSSPLLLQARWDAAVPLAMARLLPLHPRWLAGTDAAQYDFQIPGYALLDELILMEKYGIPRADVLRAATSEPALAMRRPAEFGQIKAGMRADLVLLDADPTRDLTVFHSNLGVMVRGIWLDRAALDAALRDLARIEAEPDGNFLLDAHTADAVTAEALRLSSQDIALDPKRLAPAAAALQRLGYGQAAARLMAADTDSAPGPCREILPDDAD